MPREKVVNRGLAIETRVNLVPSEMLLSPLLSKGPLAYYVIIREGGEVVQCLFLIEVDYTKGVGV